MSQLIAGLTTPETDPFFYGWRYVRREQPDGTLTSVQQPLTAEDVLHPQEDDFIMQSSAHDDDCYYLKGALRNHLRGRPQALVLHDCRIAWNHTGKYAHGPDLAVFLNVPTAIQDNYGTFNAFNEGCLPDLIIEVVSPATRHGDIYAKVREYRDLSIPLFVIVDDTFRVPRALTLIGYRPNGPSGYERFGAEPNGRLWLAPVELWLGIEGTRLRLYNRAGQPLRDLTEAERHAQAAEQRAEQEATERAVAEAAQKTAESKQKTAESKQKTAESKQKTAESKQKKAQQQAAAEAAARQEADHRAAAEAAARQEAECRATALAERVRQLEERLRQG